MRILAFLLCLTALLCPPLPALELKKDGDTIKLFKDGIAEPLVTQNARADHRPYLHPILAPDGVGELTQYCPGHHKHQTGLYWGITRLNGRDYFHNPADNYWQRVGFEIVKAKGDHVSWKTVYHLLDANQKPILEETQVWSAHVAPDVHDDHDHDNHDHDEHQQSEAYHLDLRWHGKALGQDATIGKHQYGGLFLRMPWTKSIEGRAINSMGQINTKAEGQRANWVDISMEIEGRDDHGHIAIFDHRDNAGYPQHWRVDEQLGVGPVRARTGDWTIAAGKTETIKHRFVVYTGDLKKDQLNQSWRKYAGISRDHKLWGRARAEGKRAAFLTPDEAVAATTVRDGFAVNMYANEPMITQPMAFCFDDRGRIWVAENRDYENRGRGFANDGGSRILILEDTDKDGTADKQTVFAEGIPFPAGLAVGFGGLWLGAPPNLLFIPDADGDDKADLDDIEIRLTGWGIRDRHETLNSFHWGPDGWLYGCQGYATPSVVGKPKDGKGRLFDKGAPFPKDFEPTTDGTPINGGVWRYHPSKDRFEVVAHGFSNPWGIDFDAKGQCFITACVIPHMFHVIPGGIYHRQGGRHFNPHVYQDIRTIVDHAHLSAHGGARVYLSDAFPPEHHGRIFMCNIHEHAVLSDILERKGSGFVAKHGEDFMLANNAQWIGFSLELGPAGNLYALDWHDGDICGNSLTHKDTGRIFRIAPTSSQAKPFANREADLATLDDFALANLQTVASAWHARRARVLLQQRATERDLAPAAVTQLEKIFNEHEDGDMRLRALWALHVTSSISNERLRDALSDADEYVRAWAIQLLTEDERPKDTFEGVVNLFQVLAAGDSSPVVRLYLAAALQRLPAEHRWEITKALTRHRADVNDHNIPKMLWFGFEPMVADHPERALALVADSVMPDFKKWTARRAASADKLHAVAGALADKSLVRDAQQAFLEGAVDALRGRKNVKAPDNWAAAYAVTANHENARIRQLANELGQLFGDSGATAKLLATATNPKAKPEARQTAVRQLAGQQAAELRSALPALFGDANPLVRTEAIRATAAFEVPALADKLLAGFENFNAAERQEIVQALASRPAYGRKLTDALQNKILAKSDIPAFVARQLQRVVGNSFTDVWGPVNAVDVDKAKQFKRYEKMLTAENLATGDLKLGKQVYAKTCAACHKLYGSGGLIGPDLTGSNRANLEYLLSNILTPSADIQDDYKLVVVTTRDGRTLSGNVASENDKQLTLRMVGQETVVDKSEIQSREVIPVSMMPEGQLQTLSQRETLGLIRYLQTTEDVK